MSSLLASSLRKTRVAAPRKLAQWQSARWMATRPPFGEDDDDDGGIPKRVVKPKKRQTRSSASGPLLVDELRGLLTDKNSGHRRRDNRNRPTRLPSPPPTLFNKGRGSPRGDYRPRTRGGGQNRYDNSAHDGRGNRYNEYEEQSRYGRFDNDPGYARGRRSNQYEQRSRYDRFDNGAGYAHGRRSNQYEEQNQYDRFDSRDGYTRGRRSDHYDQYDNYESHRQDRHIEHYRGTTVDGRPDFQGDEFRQQNLSPPRPPPTVNVQFGLRDATSAAARQRVARGVDSQHGQKNESSSPPSLNAFGPVADWVRSNNVGGEDIFKIPPRPPTEGSPMSDGEGNDEDKPNSPYDSLVELLDIHTDPSLNKRWRNLHKKNPIPQEDADAVVAFLKQEEIVVPLQHEIASNNSSNLDKKTFGGMLQKQKELFMEALNFDEKQYDLLFSTLLVVANMSAKKNKPETVSLIWQKVKESGIHDKKFIHVLMHLGGSVSIAREREKRELKNQYESVSGSAILDMLDGMAAPEKKKAEPVGVPEEEDEDDVRIATLVEEIATYNDILFEPTEQTITTRIRMLVSRRKALEADNLLRHLAQDAKCHIRTFIPVFRLHLDQENIPQALSLYAHMKTVPTVHFDSDFYMQLFAGLSENGFFVEGTPGIEGAESLGFSNTSGPGLFRELVDEMRENIIEISQSNAKRLYNALARGMDSELRPLGPLESLRIDNNEAPHGQELVVSRVQIDHRTGSCPRTGVELQLQQLTEEQKQKLVSGCQELALEAQQKWVHKATLKADQAIDEFLTWLDEHDGEPYTAIVDGANVGYYMQNFDQGGFNIHQIKFVVDALEKMGENPLVILPRKYRNDYFMMSDTSGSGAQRKHFYTPEEIAIRDELQASGRAYFVPPGLLDDYYWITASVAKQSVASRGEDLAVPTGDPTRWPGARPVLISNDQMRDHKLGILEPMGFRRWYSNFIVNYNFAAFVGSDNTSNEIGFSTADFFSREIQAISGENGESVFHFPIESSLSDEWFCVRFGAKRAKQQKSKSDSDS